MKGEDFISKLNSLVDSIWGFLKKHLIRCFNPNLFSILNRLSLYMVKMSILDDKNYTNISQIKYNHNFHLNRPLFDPSEDY